MNPNLPDNCLLRDVSVGTKQRISDAIFSDKKTYADEITHRLDCVEKVIIGLSEVAVLRDNDEQESLNTDFVLGLSDLIVREIKIAFLLVQGAAFEK